MWIVLIALKEIRNKTCEDPIIGLLWMPNFMLIYISQLKYIKKKDMLSHGLHIISIFIIKNSNIRLYLLHVPFAIYVWMLYF